MPPEESLYPLDWLHIVERDFSRVERLLDIDDAQAAGFVLQQATEKFLKAYLLSRGWRLRRIHDLDVLLNAAIKYDESFDAFRESCQTITTFYIIDRYPVMTNVELSNDDIHMPMDHVGPLTVRIREAIT